MNTTYFLNCVAGNLFHTKTTPAIPQNYYIGLSTSTPEIDGSNVVEPAVEAGYKRLLLTNLNEPVDGLVSNENDINFDESTAPWGVITHYVIFDSPDVDDGNLLMFGELSTHRSVETATIMTIKSGYLQLLVQNPTA